MSRYDPDAPETLAECGEVIAFADLRGALEYDSEYVNATQEFATAKVCGLVLVALRDQDGAVGATDRLELDADGVVIQVWFDRLPLEVIAEGPEQWVPSQRRSGRVRA
jgi:hypothetical protein